MATIQAPWVNLVISTMTSTTPVRAAPTALIACERRMRRRSARAGGPGAAAACQCRTMPAWDRVKETKTPMM